MSDYAWKLDRDYVEDGTGEYLPPGKGQVIEVRGPRAATEAQIERLNRGEGHAFRLYDDDGGLNLSGRIIYDKPGVVDGFEPLDDYGVGGYGCTEIRFRRPDGSLGDAVTMSTLDTVIDVLHAAGMPGFTYDPAVDAPIATVKGADAGGATTWFASCRPCWWWDEDEPDHRCAFTPEEAQVRADAHNRIHHQEVSTT